MYDQEPLFASATHTYMQKLEEHIDHDHIGILNDINFANAIAINSPSYSFPIWCHSEPDSDEIQELERSNFVTCYYWYHAFIARDWLRHWQRHHSLKPRNKSRSQWKFLLYARDFTGSRNYRAEILDRLQDKRSSILTNWSRSTNVASTSSATIDIEHANSCGIHLVAETLFDTQKLHLTEKIFKPMVMSQPFITWSPPGTLKLLKRYGFQTFQDAWSEEYDDDYDSASRMTKLIDLVKSLADMPQDEYDRCLARALPAVEHNRQWFFSSGFMDLCWQELTANFDRALDQRRYLEEMFPWGQMCEVAGRFPQVLKTSKRTVIKKLIVGLDHNIQRALYDRHPHLNEL